MRIGASAVHSAAHNSAKINNKKNMMSRVVFPMCVCDDVR